MFITYVLYSEKYDKIYIGFTSDLESRLLSHNMLATKGWTVKYGLQVLDKKIILKQEIFRDNN